jgi:ATP-dependent Clp protease ATP-binding subunit ClpC
LNRIDDTIVFRELSQDEVIEIADIFIGRLREQLKLQNLGLEISKSAQLFLAEKGYDPELGARPTKIVIKDRLEQGKDLPVDIVDGRGEKEQSADSPAVSCPEWGIGDVHDRPRSYDFPKKPK